MIVRWVTQTVTRPIKGNPHRAQHGERRTLWFLFVPLFTITRWP